jgi:hypothetical protein
MADKSAATINHHNHDGLGWITRSEPFSLEKYTNFGTFLSGIGPFQAFATYTHRLFTTIARLPFENNCKVDTEVETAAEKSLFRTFNNRIV